MDTAPAPGLDAHGATAPPDEPLETGTANLPADAVFGDPGPLLADPSGPDPLDLALFDPVAPVPPTLVAEAEGAAADGTKAAEAPALGSRVRNAARWSLINTVVMRLGNFAAGVVLARFALGPAAWGVYGVAQTVLLVLLSANELGIGLAVVRWDGDVRRFAPTVLTLSTLSSSLFYVVLFAAAPHLATALGSPGATGVLRVMCLCVVLDGVSQVPAGILTREFAQGRRMTIDALNFVLSTAVTLVLAFHGWGAMSFAWGSVVGNVAALVGCVLAAPGSLRFGWDAVQARALLRFGLPLAGASLLALGSTPTPSWSAPPSARCNSVSTCWRSTSPDGRYGSSPRPPAGSPSPASPGSPRRRRRWRRASAGHWPCWSPAVCRCVCCWPRWPPR
jgi:PST family polysaccharide transporter